MDPESELMGGDSNQVMNTDPGTEPGSWSTVTGTMPDNLPAVNNPGILGEAESAAGSVIKGIASVLGAKSSSASPTAASTGGMSTSTKAALGIGVAVLAIAAIAVLSPPGRRR